VTEPTGLAADKLRLGYDRDIVIDRLTMEVKAGQVTTLIGPNGCGKSTLLNGLARLLKPQGGTVHLNGQAIHDMDTKHLARMLGVLSQSPATPEGLTVYELVAQGRYPHQRFFQQWSAHDEAECEEAIAATHMTEFAERRIETLSGGQRQRAWIAMALAQRTPILLLDEPTTYLDVGYQLEVLELITRLHHERSMTIVMVLHDINHAARYSDHLVVLKEGNIVACGSPDEVVTEQLLADVFRVEAAILRDPNTGTPLCVPYRTIESTRKDCLGRC